MAASRDRQVAYIAWLTVCVVWGTTYLGIRIALDTFPPALLAGLRYAIAGAVLALVMWGRGERLPAPRDWGDPILIGFLLLVLGNGLVVWAQQWVPSGIAAVTVACVPFWMTGLEAAVGGGERISGRTVVGLGTGFLGIVWLVWPQLVAGGPGGHAFLKGMAALQLACVGWSLGSIYGKRRLRREHVLVASAAQMLAGGLLMVGIGTATGEWSHMTVTSRTLLAEGYLIVAGSLIGYSAYVYALQRLPVSTVSLYAFVNPVIAVLLGAAWLGEPLDGRVIGASILVLVGVGCVRWNPRPAASGVRPSHHASSAHQPHQKQDDGDDEQDPDEVTERVAADHPEQPQHDQDYRDGFKHIPPPHGRDDRFGG